jgi:hypothetical protein
MKHKGKIIIASILIIFITGFICGRLMKPFKPRDIVKTEIMMDKTDLQNKYKKITQAYIDSANNEVFNFSFRYYHLSPGLLPNYYIESNGDTVHFNKQNFFYYYSMYKISDYLSSSKSAIINSLLLESKDTTKIPIAH